MHDETRASRGDHDGGTVRGRQAARRRRIRLLQRWVINPPLLLACRLGWYGGHVIVETVGRRSGKRRRTLVGARSDEPGQLVVVAEHGRSAGWVANLTARPQVRVLVEGRWRPAHAALDPDADPEVILDGWGDPAHARAVRLFATRPLVVRLTLAVTPEP